MSDSKRAGRDEEKPSSLPGPSTNREAVPGGLEGSITEDPNDPPKHDRTADRAQGNERRSDEN